MITSRDMFVATADLELPLPAQIIDAVKALGYRPHLLTAAEARPPVADAGTVAAAMPASLAVALSRAAERRVPLLVSVHATWCGPCKEMSAGVWSDLTVRSVLAGLEVLEVDADDSPEVAKWLRVTSLPDASLLAPSGREIGRIAGVQSRSEVLKTLDKAIGLVAPPAPSQQNKVDNDR